MWLEDIASRLDAAVINALSNAQEARVKNALKFGMDTYEMFIQTQMFIPGLREELRRRVMESGKTDPLEVFRLAKEMEQIKEEKLQK